MPEPLSTFQAIAGTDQHVNDLIEVQAIKDLGVAAGSKRELLIEQIQRIMSRSVSDGFSGAPASLIQSWRQIIDCRFDGAPYGEFAADEAALEHSAATGVAALRSWFPKHARLPRKALLFRR